MSELHPKAVRFQTIEPMSDSDPKRTISSKKMGAHISDVDAHAAITHHSLFDFAVCPSQLQGNGQRSIIAISPKPTVVSVKGCQ